MNQRTKHMRYTCAVGAILFGVISSQTVAAQTTTVVGVNSADAPVDGGVSQPAITPPSSTSIRASDASQNASDIIVTAQKRNERLVDVPLSIVSSSAVQLEARGVTNTRDLGMISPSIRMDRQGNSVVPGIRGVSNVLIGATSEPNVATYIDGVYQASSNGGFIDLPDVSRIEVLKGPQGTLFGRNATGGAIQIFTIDPSFEPTGKFSAGAGNYGLVEAKGFVSVPLVQDVMALSVSGLHQHVDGYNIAVNRNNERTGAQNTNYLASRLLITPWDGARFILGGSWSSWSSRQGVGTILQNTSVYFTLLPAGTPLATRPHEQFDDVNALYKTSVVNIYLKAEIDVSIGKLTSTTAYYRNRTFSLSDGDYGPRPLQFFSSLNPVKSISQEMNLLLNPLGPVRLIAGLFYLSTDGSRNPQGQGGTTLGQSTANATQGLFVSTTFARSKSEAIAGFAEATVDVTDALSFIAGGRYTREERTAYAARTGPLSAAPQLASVVYKSFTPRLSVRYALNASSNAYFTYSKGFKGGLFNEVAFSTVPIRPETINAYELGYKLSQGPVSLNLAGFIYDYKDVQVSTRIGNITIASNAAAAKIKGVDFDASIRVTPEFTLSGAVAYLDSHYTSFPNATINIPVFGAGGLSNGTVTGVANVGGNVVVRNPKLAANASANYVGHFDSGLLKGSVSLAYTSTTYFNVANTVAQSPYAVLNARISFAPKSLNGAEIGIWGRNLTNADYLNSVQFSNFGYSGQYANPRTYGIDLSYSF